MFRVPGRCIAMVTATSIGALTAACSGSGGAVSSAGAGSTAASSAAPADLPVVAPATNPPLKSVILAEDYNALDRGVLTYTTLTTLPVAVSAEFHVTVVDVGRGAQLTSAPTRYHNQSVDPYDVPTAAEIAVQLICTAGLTCQGQTKQNSQYVGPNRAGTWVWRITAQNPGTALIGIVAVTYEKGSDAFLHTTPLWAVPLTVQAAAGERCSMTSTRDGEESSPLEPDQPSPQRSADATDGGRPDAKRRRRPPKKVSIPVVFAVVGVGLILGALWLYYLSSPGQLSAPSFATVQLASTFPVAEIRYDASSSPSAPAITKITIYVQLPSNVLNTPTGASAVLYLEAPSGISFESCPRSACRFDPNEDAYTSSQTLNFIYEDTDDNSGEAIATFFVKTGSFGYVNNDIDASAAIPRVIFLGQASVTPEFYIDYDNVAAPDDYDWSAPSPQLKNASEIRWDEPVSGGAAPGGVAVGINSANESWDSYKIFIAGALLGLAGGALLLALQEALHAND